MNNEIDREAMLIYLNDLRVMETIVKSDKQKILSISDKLEEKEIDYKVKKSNYDYFIKPPKKPELISNDEAIEDFKVYLRWLWFIFFPTFAIIFLVFEWVIPLVIVFIILLICSMKLFQERNEKIEKNEYQNRQNQKDYEKAINRIKENQTQKAKEFNETKTNYESFKKGSEDCLTDISLEKSDIEKKLQEAYSANIIPLQFRNIQGIYYLYDYMSTSNQSLSEALMQCNLEAIKRKLDRVISLQGEMIVQQAQQSAALYEQNQQILETAQATMNNTAVAAKYAQISATNSAISLKLQSKELAYQKADYWLK